MFLFFLNTLYYSTNTQGVHQVRTITDHNDDAKERQHRRKLHLHVASFKPQHSKTHSTGERENGALNIWMCLTEWVSSSEVQLRVWDISRQRSSVSLCGRRPSYPLVSVNTQSNRALSITWHRDGWFCVNTASEHNEKWVAITIPPPLPPPNSRYHVSTIHNYLTRFGTHEYLTRSGGSVFL